MRRMSACKKPVVTVAISLLIILAYHWASIYNDFAIIDAHRQGFEDRLTETSDLLPERRAGEMDIVRFDSQYLRRVRNVRQTLLEDRRLRRGNGSATDVPEIYVVTPTNAKPTQHADVTRLAETLMHVPRLWWIVVEDAHAPSYSLSALLKSFNLQYSHIATRTPAQFQQNASTDPRWYTPRGVAQRNLGIQWLLRNLGQRPITPEPIVYFADDDNTYHWKLFDEIRKVRKVGVWPVGLVGTYMVERPIVGLDGKIQAFLAWVPDRPFPIDMAGFAVNYRLIREKNPSFTYNLLPGCQESYFLQQLITRDELEPLASLCTKVLVWHTQTVEPSMDNELWLRKAGRRSDDGIYV